MTESFWGDKFGKFLRFFRKMYDLLFLAGYLLLYCLVIGVLLAIAINGCQPNYSEYGHKGLTPVVDPKNISLTL
jgi:hypothetical protein